MKRIHASAALLLVLCGALAVHAAAADHRRPNIVFILADDLGWRDVAYNGSDFHETPNIDRMAIEGVVFHHAYASSGNCAPSRACLLSGTYTPRHHVYAVQSTDRGPKHAKRLVPIPNRSGLAKDNVTLADALKSAGYATGIFGKWHLDGPDGATPAEQGFDVVFDSQTGSPNRRRDRPADPKGIFSLTRAAGEFMRESRDQGRPFFAFVSHHAIHTALEWRPDSLKKFQAKSPGAQHKDARYAACLYDLDAGIGQLLGMIRELGLEENTLVVFTSDNGATQKSSQEPLRGSKGGYYEGGIRVPFIARWPGTIRPRTKSDVPVINVDLYPTFLAVGGARPPTGKVLDGESLQPLLLGQGALQRTAIFWHFPGYLDDPVVRGRESDVRLGFRTRPVSVIRKGDWKLHLLQEEWQLDGGRAKLDSNGAIELYNLREDPGERRDLAGVNRSKRDELVADLLAWFEHAGALLPRVRNLAYSPGATVPARE